MHLLAVDQLNTYDVLLSDDVVFTKGAYDAFVGGTARRPSTPSRPTPVEAGRARGRPKVEADEAESGRRRREVELPKGAKAPLKSGGARRATRSRATPTPAVPRARRPVVRRDRGGVLLQDRRGRRGGRLRGRREAIGRRRRGGRQVSTLHKDHRDVLIAPVVQREELRPARRQQVHVPGAPRRQQDRDQDRGREGVRRQGHLASTRINRQGKTRRTRIGLGKRKDTKRAIVSLAEGHRIDIFGGPVS